MLKKVFFNVLLFISAVVFFANRAVAQTGADRILGTWMADEKNVAVEVYKENDCFKARIIWFSDEDDKSQPMETRLDFNNPDKKLRSRRVIGMGVLRNLSYHAKTDSWEDGMIYDAKHGREWNSAAVITTDGSLKVTGYWHFKFIGKTMGFKRISAADRVLVSR